MIISIIHVVKEIPVLQAYLNACQCWRKTPAQGQSALLSFQTRMLHPCHAIEFWLQEVGLVALAVDVMSDCRQKRSDSCRKRAFDLMGTARRWVTHGPFNKKIFAVR